MFFFYHDNVSKQIQPRSGDMLVEWKCISGEASADQSKKKCLDRFGRKIQLPKRE